MNSDNESTSSEVTDIDISSIHNLLINQDKIVDSNSNNELLPNEIASLPNSIIEDRCKDQLENLIYNALQASQATESAVNFEKNLSQFIDEPIANNTEQPILNFNDYLRSMAPLTQNNNGSQSNRAIFTEKSRFGMKTEEELSFLSLNNTIAENEPNILESAIKENDIDEVSYFFCLLLKLKKIQIFVE